MEELIKFIKSKCSREEIRELVKELSTKEEPRENDVPKTWEEYVETLKKGYFIDWDSSISEVSLSNGGGIVSSRNLLPTKEMAEAFLAMMQLMSLRQAWIGNWKPDWESGSENIYCITFEISIGVFWSRHKALSFPSEKMAEDFLECFKYLVEKAKTLL